MKSTGLRLIFGALVQKDCDKMCQMKSWRVFMVVGSEMVECVNTKMQPAAMRQGDMILETTYCNGRVPACLQQTLSGVQDGKGVPKPASKPFYETNHQYMKPVQRSSSK